jgi:nucleotide-binding universal stress UspA family protein
VTVVVGYRSDKIGLSGLHLAVRIARTLGTSLTVATIVPRPWLTPSLARVDGEYEHWADHLAADSAAEAARRLGELADEIEVNYHYRSHKSVPGGLIEVVEEVSGEVLVLGSLPSAPLGQVVIGSTAERLLHTSPVPVVVSPRGYRAHTGPLTRVTSAYSATAESVDVVRGCVELAKRFGVPMRVITFAVRGRTMYPPKVGLDAEDLVLDAWAMRAREIQRELKADGVVGEDVVMQVISGKSWEMALDAAEWENGEILAVGTSPRGEIARVFLGSRATKIIRNSPVPVLVLPG